MRPILFNTNGVRAILEGEKTVTLRAVKPQQEDVISLLTVGGENRRKLLAAACAPYRPGDVLYVRETWQKAGGIVSPERFFYKADYTGDPTGWRPSIHMPKAAARIFLRVTDVRLERLRDIGKPVWDRTVEPKGNTGGEANPWVWVIEFDRICMEKAI